ncbi:uncharacterized protein LOC110429633 [Sorghum bicolor]|uniref:NAC domain-containing protein n=1 Tax=Sorghum bicolor TaxID=4558 RepID=A0A1B6PDN6_SORBI|nr:uncharacterized protein LOC110429633 [Sorghum bicolor]KXG23802.1 hypothetical protein SORBI_3008G142100 [Sorghum bicolor]|eukprot:XP_021301549.1 uncharacterized protein LOC110429633 [Sorghum bicolor]
MTAAACSSQSHPFAAPTFAVVVEDERYRVVDSPRNGGDAEILRHLGELLKQYHSIGEAGVNARLPSCDPWDIPAMPVDEGEGSKMREKYFVTDDCTLKSSCTTPATKSGYWKPRDLGWGIPSSEVIGPALVTGLKTTYDFHIGETIYQEGSKGTSWIMDVYFLIDNGQVEDDLLLCHVFKGNSRDYVARPRCAAHHHESPKEKEIQGQSNNSLLERPGGLLATHISSNKHQNQRLFENKVLL